MVLVLELAGISAGKYFLQLDRVRSVELSMCLFLRMLSDGFLKENHDNDGTQLQVVPLTIELRPLYDGSNFPLGFMVPVDQVSLVHDVQLTGTWFPNRRSKTVLKLHFLLYQSLNQKP